MKTKKGVGVLIARLDQIETKVDAVKNHAAAIDVTLAGQAVELKEHIRRTGLLEELVKPLHNWFQRFKGIAALAGIGITVAELVHSFWK